MNHLEHFGLLSEPFVQDVPARGFYKSAGHGRALLQLLTALEEGQGLLVLTGAPGVGKTALLRTALANASDEGLRAAWVQVGEAGLTEEKLAGFLALQLGFDGNCRSLKALPSKPGERRAILIDNAERLSPSLLASLAEVDGFAVLLAGREGVEWPVNFERVEIEPFNEHATEGYVRTRLKAAGQRSTVFSDDSIKKIHELSAGVPEAINRLCDQAMLAGMLRGDESVGAELVSASALVLGNGLGDYVGMAVPPSPSPSPAEVQAGGNEESDDDFDFDSDKWADETSLAEEEDVAPQSGEDSQFGDVLDRLEAEDEGDAVDDFLTAASGPVLPSDEATEPHGVSPAFFDGAAGDVNEDDSAGDNLDSLLNELSEETSEDDGVGELSAEEGGLEEEALDDMFDDFDSDAAAEEDDLDDLLNDLQEPEAMAAGASVDAGDALEDDFGDMLVGLGDEPEDSGAASNEMSADDELSSLLEGFDEPAESESAAAEPELASGAQSEIEDDFDDFFSEQDGTSLALDEDDVVVGSDETDVGSELDDLLSGFEGEDDAVSPSAGTQGEDDFSGLLSDLSADDGDASDLGGESTDEFDELLGNLTIADGEQAEEPIVAAGDIDDDFESMLGELGVEVVATQGNGRQEDDIDDLLGELEESVSTGAEGEGEDELDDLLGGLLDDADDDDDVILGNEAEENVDDELAAFLDEFEPEEKSVKQKAEAVAVKVGGDELEDELDSLLDGLGD